MNAKLNVALACLILGLTGCSKDPSEEMVEVMEDMAAIMANNMSDCDKMGAELSAFADASSARLAELKTLEKAKSDEARKAAGEKYRPRLDAVKDRIREASKACRGHQKLGDTMKRLR